MVNRDTLAKSILVKSLSEEHVSVIEKLDEPRYDEDIAAELKIKATIVRTLLNDLHANSLVEYERFKNKSTGWYTYLWKRRDDRIQNHVQKYLENKLRDLSERLDQEKQSIQFNCSCNQVAFDVALDFRFVCPDCNEKYGEYDNSDMIDQLVVEIANINSLLEQT